MKVVILAGGGGTRLFPLSRACYPKQFLKVTDDYSLLAQTVQRFLSLVRAQDIIIVTNKEYLHHVQTELALCGGENAHILLEPEAHNTAPAIAYAARYCMGKLGADSNEVLFVTPSDHIVRPVPAFLSSVKAAEGLAAEGYIVTFGIKPDKPETGYGYIQAGEALGKGYKVASFKEKPDAQTAQQYLAAGNYFWNSGMFAFKIETLLQELASHQPQIAELSDASVEEIQANFASMPSISIDYAVAEKSDKVATIPFTAYWNDIGSWDAIYEVLDKDGDGNAIKGDCLTQDCANSLLMGSSRLIAGIGLEDLLVVETNDVILVSKRGESQKVKEVVSQLKGLGRKEATEHTTMYRPWGSYTVLLEGPTYKIKKIVVKQGGSLSLQLHYHRSEHWIVTRGTAEVTLGDSIHLVHKGESIFIPQTTKHRLTNPGKMPLEIIEVQNGDYLGEDDIVRFEDNYGRL